MTKQELKSLEHIQIISENQTTLHIHTDKDYILYTIEKFTKQNQDGEEYTDYSISGSNCYYFPAIFDEYPLYKIITQSEYDKLVDEFETISVEEKKIIYDEFIK